MKTFLILMISAVLLGLSGCNGGMPNLVVDYAEVSFTSKEVKIGIANIGNATAKGHLTYIEINVVGVDPAATPQSQYTANVPEIKAGEKWKSGAISFDAFSSPRGLVLSDLTTANLVIRADAKNRVKESDENDNLYDANH